MPQLARCAVHQVDEIAQALDTDGACIALGVHDDGLIDALCNDFQPHLDALVWGVDEFNYRDEFYGLQTKRLHGLFERSPHMVDVLTQPLFLTLAERWFIETGIGRDLRLSNAELMALGSGQTNQMLHNDAVSWARAQAAEDGEILLSANCALTDFTADNGATRVVPGSHRWSADRTARDDEICLAAMPRGSALLYVGNVLHSGGENRTDAVRMGLYLGYIPSWLRPIENHLVTNSRESIARLPEAAQRLLDVTPSGLTVYA
ncbi:MAG: phytanoyl-CoA dioxygenase family protein [Pseudomonadota bacterium]